MIYSEIPCGAGTERFREFVNLSQVNGNYTFMPIHPSPVPMQSLPQYAQYPQHVIEPHNYNVPPMPPVNMPTDIGENSLPNNGHQAAGYTMPHHQMIMGQPIPHSELMLQPGTDRVYYPQYPRMPEEHRAPTVPFRPEMITPQFLQSNMHIPPMYAQEPPIAREDIFNPAVTPDMLAEFRVNPPPTYSNLRLDPRADAVWAPNPGEMFNFVEMRNALPAPAPHAEAFPQRSTILPLASCRSSPVDGAGPRAVGGPVSVPNGPAGPNGPVGPVGTNGPTRNGPSPVPTTNDTRLGSKIPMLIHRRADQPTVTERLAAAAKAYQVTGSDDQELEAGLQALERRIDTEFKNAD